MGHCLSATRRTIGSSTSPSQTGQVEFPTKPLPSTTSSLPRQAERLTTLSSTAAHPGPSTAQQSRQNEAGKSDPVSVRPSYDVFISCVSEDETTIALPLREKLMNTGITAFVDFAGDNFSAVTSSENAIVSAMESARIAVIVLSPEFIAREWPMKDLMWFLRRREETAQDWKRCPVIIPFFYRLSLSELIHEPRFDRVDKKGQNLYEVSRFFERKDAGEPEANVDNVRAALQKLFWITGVQNDLDASNDASYVMSQRREVLLQDLCDRIQQSMSGYFQMHPSAASKNLMFTKEDDVFRPSFDEAYDASRIVLDFASRDESGDAITQEGRVLDIVLDDSQAKKVIAIRGIGGVGKTTILRGISGLDKVKERFRDGVYHLALGMDVTLHILIRQLSEVVERSGGRKLAKEMLMEDDIARVSNSFRSWFAKKKCLFIFDDVWENKEIHASVISQLMRLHVTGTESKILLTTRSMEIASSADAFFPLEPRSTLGIESRSILLRNADIRPADEEGEQAVEQILKLCNGLPLFLSIAGRTVKALSLRGGGGPAGSASQAYQVYAHNLANDMQSLLRADFYSYGNLQTQLMTSIGLIEERKESFAFQVRHSMAELYRRLSVLTKHSKAPMRMLQFLWELENELQAAMVAREFEEVGLVNIEFERRETELVEVLLLHDSAYVFAVGETRKHGEDAVGHGAVLNGYSRGLAINNGILEWWHESLQADGYIHENLCRHLLGDERVWELVQLLQSPQWTERQLGVNGISSLEADFAHGIEAVRNKLRNISDDERAEMKAVLLLILKSAVLAWSYVKRNFRELWFQIHGRLILYRDTFEAIRKYLNWIETEAETPVALVANRFLGLAGSSNTRIISLGAPIQCMSVLRDGNHVVCGCQDGRIFVLQTNQSRVERQWKAHDEAVLAISLGTDGTRLVSSSRDNTAKVWELETGRCVAVFEGHTDSVSGVAVMKDGKRVVSVSHDGTANVWDMETAQIISGFSRSRDERTECMATLWDKEDTVIVGYDNKLRIWNATTGAEVGDPLDGHNSAVSCVTVTPDARYVVTGSMDHTARVWDLLSHQRIGSLEGHARPVTSVAVSRDGCRLVTGSMDGVIQAWDLESQTTISDPLQGHTDTVSGVSFLGNADHVMSCSWDGTVRIWDLTRRSTETLTNRHEEAVSSVSFTPDGRFVLSGSYDNTLRVSDTISGYQVEDPMMGHSGVVTDAAVTPDGQFVVSVSRDRTVRLWDFESREVLHTLTGHSDDILCVAITPQGDRIATGSDDRTVRIWGLPVTHCDPVVLDGHSASVRRVFVSDDGLRIVSVDDDDNVFVWELETKKHITLVSQKDAWKLSRGESLNLVGETTVHGDAQLSIPLGGREILYGKRPEPAVLATMEADVYGWALSPDKKTICVGLSDGQLGLIKLHV